MILEFQFKGDRDYVHGTDMINKFIEIHSETEAITAQIRKMTSKNLYIKKDETKEDIVCAISIKTSDQSSDFFLVETDTVANGRYSYNESNLVADSEIDASKKEISMSINAVYTLLENLVALQKKLVTELISSNVKWLFVGLELKRIPEVSNNDVLKLRIERSLGTKLVESRIILNEKPIGYVRFSSIRKN